MMSAPKVAIVVLNYNTKNLLNKFIPFIEQTNYENFEIIVVDNASNDGSLDLMTDEFPHIRTITLDGNYGYAGGYNKALEQIDAPFWVLLNSDIEVHANWLSPMMDMMQQDDAIGAIQPKILDITNREKFEYAGASGGYMDAYGYAFCKGRLFDHCEQDLGQYNDRTELFWASGAALLVRSDAYKKAGGLDEDFFAHMEEIDLCWRMQNLGYQVWNCPESKVWHIGGGTLNAYHSRKTYLNFRNNLVLLVKNLNRKELLSKLFVRLVLDGPAALKLLFSQGFGHFWAVVRAHWSFFIRFYFWWKKRGTVPKKRMNALTGYYPKSLVWRFFVKREKKYSNLSS